ncbi:hypothetical protein V7152_18935 [Neobacillus drentensis]|uniref:hypothetical protein n=1 Tax=Neobacillus drentensis TaxID=220684 RepID=UPI002FFEC1EB
MGYSNTKGIDNSGHTASPVARVIVTAVSDYQIPFCSHSRVVTAQYQGQGNYHQ